MRLVGHDIGVCSWSLRVESAEQLVRELRALELSHTQLALGPLLDLEETKRDEQWSTIRSAGVTVTAGMIHFAGEDYSSIPAIRKTGGFVPNDKWEERLARSVSAAELAGKLGLSMVSTHVGFIPHSNHGDYKVMVERVTKVADAMNKNGVLLLMETGQESASELLQFLNDLNARNVGVNFDPANMILYGAGDPIEAVKILGRHVRHVHLKDAVASSQPGSKWGEEVPFGKGEVPVPRFIATLRRIGYEGPLVIEREAGDDRTGDVRFAIQTLRSLGEGKEAVEAE